MTTIDRLRLIRSLTRYLADAGFRNIRSRDRSHEAPLPLVLDAAGHPVIPDVTTRSGTGKLDVYLVVSADELGTEEHAKRIASAAEATEEQGTRLWLAVPAGERERARKRLDELGVGARLLQV